jgi:hypothetical protein
MKFTGLISACAVLAMALFASSASAQYYGGGYGGRGTVVCESRDYRDNYCPVDTRGGVRLIRQISRTACYEGESWGYDRRGIWVSGGCGAEFEVGGRGYGGGSGGGYGGGYGRPGYGGGYSGGGHGGGQRVLCESRDYRYNYCPVRVRRDVDLVAQYSKTDCRFNRNWGYDRGGIWVDQGCSAEFAVY